MQQYDIHEKLGRIEARISQPGFLSTRGLGNEVGYYVFDYEPRHEILVRKKVSELVDKYAKGKAAFRIVKFDLFDIMIDLLQSKGYLDKSYEFESKRGIAFAAEAISKALRLSGDNLLVQHILANTPENSVVLITGVGKCYPLVRSHNVLNILQQVLDTVPVILFCPGQYSGFDLQLFGTLSDGNHYRALQLIV